ncbi:hypothetical protein Epa17_00062 [Pseudomonas phage Epa17]|uniref:Primase/helicase protein n=4 Tax=Nankokuvirus G1 TaxID=2560662 RepID=A0A6G9LEN5_9CAUD|nr:hypothetical protein Epa24_00095 [Pseudomonas phage Epa24]QIQ64065.1 hypothetical protein Epa17_00062 [Pseudomonas phage Epa17]QIQ64957.1 hypothetical protein 16_00144 [Pseudomonas phage Epa16]QIQ65592.1 hypothetical protein 26_00076 [Pseudomonas phage Epa26]
MLIGKFACVLPGCDSSDAMAVYEDEPGVFGGRCFSCDRMVSNNTLARSPLGEELGAVIIKGDRRAQAQRRKEEKEVREIQRKPVITAEDREKIQGNGGADTTLFRGIARQTNEKYGCITHYADNEPVVRYYPIHDHGELVGYKVRQVPKSFYAIGRNDKHCELYGQHLFPAGGKYLLIVGGEEDAHAAYQMLRVDQLQRWKKKNPYADIADAPLPYPVVSPTVGETSAASQLAANYEYINSFDEIILMFDADEKGEQGAQAALEVLPMGKVRIANLPGKDPNKMLEDKQAKAFINAFFDARKASPAGIVGSGQIREAMLNKAMAPKLPLPSFLYELSRKTAGGFPLNSIVNLIAGSGIGKTTWVNELVYHWIFNSPYKMGIVTLEADIAEYGGYLLSRHLGQKLALIEDPQEYLATIESDRVEQASNELFLNADGSDRFLLVDDRGDHDAIKQKIEQMIISGGIQVIVLDPMSDLIDGMDTGEQALFMKWQKQMVKAYDVIFINVNHTRKGKDNKTAASRGAELSEEDIIGSSTIYKSGNINITLVRNKHAEDDLERNTTLVTLTKCRHTGYTGPAGRVLYNIKTHTLISLTDFLNQQVEEYNQVHGESEGLEQYPEAECVEQVHSPEDVAPVYPQLDGPPPTGDDDIPF